MGMPNVVISADLKSAWCAVCRDRIETGIPLPVKVADLDALLDEKVKPWATAHAVCHLKPEANQHGKNLEV